MARSALLAAFLLLAGSTQAADTLCLIHPSPARSTPFPSIEAHEIAALYYWPESMTIFGRTRRLFVAVRSLQRDASGDRRILKDRADVLDGCRLLVEQGWLRNADRPKKGRGPAGTWFELHPTAFSS